MNITAQGTAWVARVAAMVFAAFLGTFALDVSEGTGPTVVKARDLAVHLIPSAQCALIIAMPWSRPWIGAGGGLVLAIGHLVLAWDHPSWLLTISVPMVVLVLLYTLCGYSIMQNKA